MDIIIHCAYTKLVPIETITPHPDNENVHNEAQIKALAKIIKNDGVRHPIILSGSSGFICCGHGRLEAFQLLGMKNAPIDIQYFDSPEQEMRVRTADNNIAKYAEFNTNKFHTNLETLNLNLLELDMEQYGLLPSPDYKVPLDDYSKNNKELETDKFGNDLDNKCPRCGFEFNG
jgi:hypothetical protein